MTDLIDLTEEDELLGPERTTSSVNARVEGMLDTLGIKMSRYAQAMDDAVTHAIAARPGLPALPVHQRWVLVGPRNVGGRIASLAQDPTNPLILYAGTAHGGLWRTTDRGDTWVHLGGPQHNFPVSAIAIPEQDPNTIYIGTGSAKPKYVSGRGLYRVTINTPPAAPTFVQLAPAPPPTMPPDAMRDIPEYAGSSLRYTRIRMDPYDPSRFWAASQTGLWRWETNPDTGEGRFILEFPPPDLSDEDPRRLHVEEVAPAGSFDAYATDLLVTRDISDDATVGDDHPIPRYLVLYLAVSGAGVYRGRFDRRDKTTAFEDDKLPVPPDPNKIFGRVQLALCERDPRRVYALMELTGEQASPVYRSDDGGRQWIETTVAFDSKQKQADYNLVLEVSPADPDVIYAGIIDAFLSRDGGDTWKQILRWREYNQLGDYAQHADQHAALFDRFERRRLWVGNDGGLAIVRDLQKPLGRGYWRVRGHGIAAGQFQDVAVNYGTNRQFFTGGGLQDNGSWMSFGGPTWIHVGWGDGANFAFNATDSRRFVISEQFAHTRGRVDTPLGPPPIFNPILHHIPDSIAPLNAMGVTSSNIAPLSGTEATAPFIPIIAQNPNTPADLILGWQTSTPPPVGGVPAAQIPPAFFSTTTGTTPPAAITAPGVTFTNGTEATAACFGPTIPPGAANVDGWIGLTNGTLLHTTTAPPGPWASPPMPLPLGTSTPPVSGVAVYPRDPRTVVVCTSGIPGRVFITYDRGRTWQEITARVPTGISVTADSLSIPVGQRKQFRASATYASGPPVDITASASWSTSNVLAAEFQDAPGEEGQLITKSAGAVTVTAAWAGTGTVPPGTPNVTVTDGSGDPPRALPPAVRRFDLQGLPNCPMTSLAFDPGASGRLFVGTLGGVFLLEDIPVPGALTISPSPANLRVGQTIQLTVQSAFSDGTPRDVTTEVDFSMPASAVAQLGTGTPPSTPPSQVTGAAPGSVVVTVRRGTESQTVTVNVAPAGGTPIPPAPPAPTAAVAPVVNVNWRPFSAGLPLTQVNDLVFVPTTRMLRAATFGRGIWDCDMDQATRPRAKLLIRQNVTDSGYLPRLPLPFTHDPRTAVQGTVFLDQAHAFDIRVDAPPFHFFDDRVDGVEFDERLGVDTLKPAVRNAIYVQVHNIGRESVNVKLHLYFRLSPIAAPVGSTAVVLPNTLGDVSEFYLPPSFEPPGGGSPAQGTVWTRIGTDQTLPGVGPGAPVVARFDWEPPRALAGQNVVLLALCSGPDAARDQLPAPPPAGTKVNTWISTEQRAALRIVAVAPMPLADIFVSNGVDDDGRNGSVASPLRSPHIVVVQSEPDDPPEQAFKDLLDVRPQDKVVLGGTNHIYVRVRNRGLIDVTAVVDIFAVKIQADLNPVVDPTQWTRITPSASPFLEVPVPAGEWRFAHVEWPGEDPAPTEALKNAILIAIIRTTTTDDPDVATSFVNSEATFRQFLARQAGSDNIAARALRVVSP